MRHYVTFRLRGDPERAKMTVVEDLAALGFRLTWLDQWTAYAERGSKVGNVLAGAAAQYFKVGLRVLSGPSGESMVQLEQLSSGWMGGAIGAHRTRKNMERLRDDLWRRFYEAGVLIDVNAA